MNNITITKITNPTPGLLALIKRHQEIKDAEQKKARENRDKYFKSKK